MNFPDPREHEFTEWIAYGGYFYRGSDIVSIGDPLTVANLTEAYTKGIFPWHMDGMPLPWFCPERRAVLDFADLKLPRSLAKERRRSDLKFTIDHAFADVIDACSLVPRSGQKGTWITDEFIERYTELHSIGIAHSVEAWDRDGVLVGGLYGIDAGGLFCGESMFYKQPNASKLALLFLIDHLATRGSTWIDIQVMTPHMHALGAIEIDRADFLDRLVSSQASNANLFGPI